MVDFLCGAVHEWFECFPNQFTGNRRSHFLWWWLKEKWVKCGFENKWQGINLHLTHQGSQLFGQDKIFLFLIFPFSTFSSNESFCSPSCSVLTDLKYLGVTVQLSSQNEALPTKVYTRSKTVVWSFEHCGTFKKKKKEAEKVSKLKQVLIINLAN